MSSSISLTAAVGFAVIVMGSAACQDARPTGVMPSASLAQRTHLPASTTPLTPVSLTSQAEFDALETRVLGRRRVETLLAVYEALVGDLEPPTAAKALAIQRMIRLKVDAGSERRLLSEGLEQSRRFTLAQPDQPHAVYLEGYIRRKLLISDGGTSALLVNPSTLDAAQQVVVQWERLLVLAPDYIGPDGHDAKAIRADVDRLSAAVAQLKATPESVLANAVPRVAPTDEIETMAWGLLGEFEAGNTGVRRIACREWKNGKRGGSASTASITLDLQCALQAADADAAISAFEKLAATRVATDRCAWAGRILGVTASGTRASIEARVTKVAPGCKR
ncbi:MAG: hypothetical protein ACI9MR_005011 [Myxococcota bacterium]|jgi:hypothetical protein